MECPNCRLINPEKAERCDCGYDFTTRKHAPKAEERKRNLILGYGRVTGLILGSGIVTGLILGSAASLVFGLGFGSFEIFSWWFFAIVIGLVFGLILGLVFRLTDHTVLGFGIA